MKVSKIWLGFIVLLFGCVLGGRQAQAAAPVELNQQYELSQVGESWEFSLEQSGRIRIWMERVHATSVNYSLYRYDDTTGAYVGYAKGKGRLGTETADSGYLTLMEGTYRCEMEVSADSLFDALVTVQYQSSHEYWGETEENGGFEQSNLAELNQTYEGSFDVWGDYDTDTDCYQVKMERPGVLQVALSFAHTESYWRALEIYEADEYGNTQALFQGSVNYLLKYDSPQLRLPAGTYYIVLKGSRVQYQVKFQYQEQTLDECFEEEKNDFRDMANPITVNQTYTGNFNSYQDQDYYCVNISVPSVAYVELSTPRKEFDGACMAFLYEANSDQERLLLQSSKQPYIKSESLILQPGTYYLRVTGSLEPNEKYQVSLLTTPYVPVSGITISRTSCTMTEGEEMDLTASVTPGNASFPSVAWESSNDQVASVNLYGRVTAKQEGTATITVRSLDGGYKSASCQVTVAPPKKVTPESESGMVSQKTALNKKKANITVGDTLRLKLNSTKGPVVWKSKNKSIASVTSKGVVKGKKIGTATIQARYQGRTYTCKVTVKSRFKAGTWFGYSNGGFYCRIFKVQGKKMRVSIHMPYLTKKNMKATILPNGKTAFLKFKCKDKKVHKLTLSTAKKGIKVKEVSSCKKKLLRFTKAGQRKRITHMFR